MAISPGDRIPDATLMTMGEGGPQPLPTGELFAGKKVVLFAVPGAFTPTCSAKHVPGFLAKADEILAKGVAQIVCLSVNDAFVMGAWGKDQSVGDKIVMAGDGTGAFTKALGLELDLTGLGLGVRSQRFALIAEDGVVKNLFVEENPGGVDVSGADNVLKHL